MPEVIRICTLRGPLTNKAYNPIHVTESDYLVVDNTNIQATINEIKNIAFYTPGATFVNVTQHTQLAVTVSASKYYVHSPSHTVSYYTYHRIGGNGNVCRIGDVMEKYCVGVPTHTDICAYFGIPDQVLAPCMIGTDVYINA